MKKRLPITMSINILFLGLVFIFAVAYTSLAFAMPFGSLRSPGAGFIPRIVGVLAVIISAALLLNDILKGEGGQKEKLAHPMRFIWYLVSFIGYVLIFRPVGYVISTMLFTFVLCKVMGNKIWLCAVIGVCTGVAFYIVFSLLSVPLPMGILSGLKLL